MNALDVAVLQALRGAAVHVSCGELAGMCQVDLEGVEKCVGELREAGFEIEERPGLGLRLVASPDRLMAGDLHARLGECALAREILVFEETGSTNEVAMGFGARGAEAGIVIFAERQSAGRGRFGRKWESRSHLGVWFSVLLRPDLPAEKWPRMTTCAAVALAAAMESHAGVRVEIKWPNDLYAAGKKVAGILVETGADAVRGPFAVLGVGVNVNHEADDFPPELREKAGSLRMAAIARVDRPALAAALLRALDGGLQEMDVTFPATLAEAQRRSALIGRWVRVGDGDAVREGRAEGLDAEGQLLLREGSGELRRLSAGEVTLAGL